jgi:hypothetical protein
MAASTCHRQARVLDGHHTSANPQVGGFSCRGPGVIGLLWQQGIYVAHGRGDGDSAGRPIREPTGARTEVTTEVSPSRSGFVDLVGRSLAKVFR